MRKGRSQKGTRLRLYWFCQFAINDPTLLHSRAQLYMSEMLLGKAALANSHLLLSLSSLGHLLDVRQVRNTQIPLLALPLLAWEKRLHY